MQQFLENKKEALRLGVHNTRWNPSPQGGLGWAVVMILRWLLSRKDYGKRQEYRDEI